MFTLLLIHALSVSILLPSIQVSISNSNRNIAPMCNPEQEILCQKGVQKMRCVGSVSELNLPGICVSLCRALTQSGRIPEFAGLPLDRVKTGRGQDLEAPPEGWGDPGVSAQFILYLPLEHSGSKFLRPRSLNAQHNLRS